MRKDEKLLCLNGLKIVAGKGGSYWDYIDKFVIYFLQHEDFVSFDPPSVSMVECL